MTRKLKPAIERFMDRVSPEPNSGCWLWTGATLSNGYGTFSPKQVRGERIYAHRHAYETFVGPIEVGLVIDHLCRVRCCVNPDHLEVVTRGENVRRGNAPSHVARRASRCENGHPLVEGNIIGKAKPRCWTCYSEWKEQREVARLLERIAHRARAMTAPNQSKL